MLTNHCKRKIRLSLAFTSFGDHARPRSIIGDAKGIRLEAEAETNNLGGDP